MSPATSIVTRFAPSPTGYLHLGHAFAALFADARAAEAGGRFLLRIEDIDQGRAKPEFETAIRDDLRWLGLAWEEPARRQSEHMDDYRRALEDLDAQGLLYPCFCTRKDIRAEIENAGLAPHDAPEGTSPGAGKGPEGPLYPGTCRGLAAEDRARRTREGRPFALRLDMTAAVARVAAGGPLEWTDGEQGRVTARPELFGDVVLARKETPTSYHLAVTVDDHLQGVTLVTRGRDLFAATHVHRLLQALLGLATPDYHHHRLLTAETGERLAKRHRAATIRALREAGKTPAQVREMAGFGPGGAPRRASGDAPGDLPGGGS